MIILLAVTTEPILRNSKNENALTPLDSAVEKLPRHFYWLD
jgi:hypothetical protein